MIKRTVLIVLCLVNLLTITFFSAQNAEKSTEVSEGVTVKVVATVTGKPEAEVKKSIKEYDKYTRSFAHFFLFMTLGALLYLTVIDFDVKLPFLKAFTVCFAYALFDESYQALLKQGRAFELVDLIKDWAGSLTGILVVYFMRKIVKRCKNSTLH